MSNLIDTSADCLIDWNSPVLCSRGKPLIPLPASSNALESMDDNNPFDALERQLADNDPFTLNFEFKIKHNEEHVYENKANEISLSNISADDSKSNLTNEEDVKAYVANRVSKCITEALRSSNSLDTNSIISSVSYSTPKSNLLLSDYSSLDSRNFQNDILETGFCKNATADCSYKGTVKSLSSSYISSILSAESPIIPKRVHNMSLPEFSLKRFNEYREAHHKSINALDKLKLNEDEYITSEIPNWDLSEYSSDDDEKLFNDLQFKTKSHNKIEILSMKQHVPLTLKSIKDSVGTVASINVKTNEIEKGTNKPGPMKAIIPVENMTKPKSIKGKCERGSVSTSQMMKPKQDVIIQKKKTRFSLEPVASSTPTITQRQRSTICAADASDQIVPKKYNRRSLPCNTTKLSSAPTAAKPVSRLRAPSPDSTSGYVRTSFINKTKELSKTESLSKSTPKVVKKIQRPSSETKISPRTPLSKSPLSNANRASKSFNQTKKIVSFPTSVGYRGKENLM